VNANRDVWLGLIPAFGMMAVAVAAVLWWRVKTKAAWRWLFIGAALWTIAVAIKLAIAIATNAAMISFLQTRLPHGAYVTIGSLYVGLQSSICEIGLTWLAVLIWRQFGKDAERAVGIGVGAGAFEAFLLGMGVLAAVLVSLSDLPKADLIRQQMTQSTGLTPLVWLVAPVERIIAVLGHASTRALVLLGTTYRKPLMVVSGFLIFTFADTVAGGAHLSGAMTTISIWWVELALLPVAIVSVPILRWCFAHWPRQ
jgi:uncharacterized membrane protein YhfC